MRQIISCANDDQASWRVLSSPGLNGLMGQWQSFFSWFMAPITRDKPLCRSMIAWQHIMYHKLGHVCGFFLFVFWGIGGTITWNVWYIKKHAQKLCMAASKYLKWKHFQAGQMPNSSKKVLDVILSLFMITHHWSANGLSLRVTCY